jgi:hypothetical protein
MKSSTHIVFRKISSFLLVGVYLLFSIGILKATHFCMGRKAYESFFTIESEKCGCSEWMEESSDCCDDEHGLLKIDDEQKTISTFALNVPQWMVLEKIYTQQLITVVEPTHQEFGTHDPPPPDRPLFQKYCSFVFYDDEMMA